MTILFTDDDDDRGAEPHLARQGNGPPMCCHFPAGRTLPVPDGRAAASWRYRARLRRRGARGRRNRASRLPPIRRILSSMASCILRAIDHMKPKRKRKSWRRARAPDPEGTRHCRSLSSEALTVSTRHHPAASRAPARLLWQLIKQRCRGRPRHRPARKPAKRHRDASSAQDRGESSAMKPSR